MNGRDVESRHGVPFPSVFHIDLGFNSLLEASEPGRAELTHFPGTELGDPMTSSSGN